MGDVYRRQFAGERFSEQELVPHIHPDQCRFKQPELVCNSRSGFDLPLLFSHKANFSGNIIVLASQDPLRTKNDDNALTMYTPWGFSSPKTRSRGGKILWPLVEWLCEEGFGVYLTDIWKIWPTLNGSIAKHEDLIERQKRTLQSEIEAIEAQLWITLGVKAANAARQNNLRDFLDIVHPTARPDNLRRALNIPDTTFESIRRGMKTLILDKLRSTKLPN